MTRVCGLAGIYNFRSLAPAELPAVKRMTRVLRHRGPDDEGSFFDGEVGMGFRRLCILDLSERGHQPMRSADGRYVIVFNGEIYNYVELRQELETHGDRFRSDGDTEVLLALYARYGATCLEYLNGMFAFAVWDSVDRQLFLARDRVGIKPLYYIETNAGVMFASEIKALVSSGLLSPTVDTSKIDTYLTFGFIPGVETIFQGVKKVLPGEWLRISSRDIQRGAYWDVDYLPNYGRSVQDTAEGLLQVLQDAMRKHLRSDVAVGVFLSGGLDSATTVALLAESGVRNLKTFSVAHKIGGEFDETHYARIVAERFGTQHHVLYVDPNDFREFIPRFVWYMDEPVAEAPAIPFYFISKLLREHVTVALSGEGSDELFAGYSVYRYMRWIEAYRKVPERVRSVIEPIVRSLAGEKVSKYIQLARQPLANRYRGVSNYDQVQKGSLYTDEFRAAVAERRLENLLNSFYGKTRGRDAMTQMLYVDLKAWLPDDLLIKADRMTMANSVELRVPFLDHRVIEYAATVPSHMKLRRGIAKWILKRAMRGHLPPAILRRKKLGFPTPLAWLLGGESPDYVRDLLLSTRSVNRGFFTRKAVETLIQEVGKDNHRILWQLVVLEEWHKQFIDQAASLAA